MSDVARREYLVLDYGADPTGRADSSAAIQAAINTAVNEGHAELGLPPGTFACSSELATPNQAAGSLRIRGAGRAATTLLATSSMEQLLSLRMVGSVEDLTVDAGGLANNGLALTTALDVNLDHMDVGRVRCTNLATGAGYSLSVVDTTSSYRIRRCTLDDVVLDGQGGMSVAYADSCWIRQLANRNAPGGLTVAAATRLYAEGLDMAGAGTVAIGENVGAALLVAPVVEASSAPLEISAQDAVIVGGELASGLRVNPLGYAAARLRIVGATLGSAGAFYPPIVIENPVAALAVESCDVLAIGAGSITAAIYDASPAGLTVADGRIVGNTFQMQDAAAWIQSANGVDWGPVVITGNTFSGTPAAATGVTLQGVCAVHSNLGLPAVATPAVPAASTNLTNTTGVDVDVYIAGGTSVDVTVDGVATGLAGGAFRLAAGATINLGPYSAAPTWAWAAR